MFFRQITEAFLVRTDPDSSMVKPAAIHITSPPQRRNEKVLRTKAVSSATAAYAALDPAISRPSTKSSRTVTGPRRRN